MKLIKNFFRYIALIVLLIVIFYLFNLGFMKVFFWMTEFSKWMLLIFGTIICIASLGLVFAFSNILIIAISSISPNKSVGAYITMLYSILSSIQLTYLLWTVKAEFSSAELRFIILNTILLAIMALIMNLVFFNARKSLD